MLKPHSLSAMLAPAKIKNAFLHTMYPFISNSGDTLHITEGVLHSQCEKMEQLKQLVP